MEFVWQFSLKLVNVILTQPDSFTFDKQTEARQLCRKEFAWRLGFGFVCLSVHNVRNVAFIESEAAAEW